MQLFIKLMISSVYIASCTSTKPIASNEVPQCIQQMVEKFKAEVKQNPPRSITEYTWQGKRVYYITSPCCDQFNAVYDSSCNFLGAPDGGITGKGDGKLPGFAANAGTGKLIWKDER